MKTLPETATPIPIVFTAEDFELRSMITSLMAQAQAAQVKWSATPIRHRLKIIRALRHRIAEQSWALANAAASGRGRPALESLTAEVLPLAEACRFLEREAQSLLAPRVLGRRGLPLWLAGVRSEIGREPFGVVLIIGPGNYPLLLAGVQLLQALVAGNAVLLKPGVSGSPAARMLRELLIQSGLNPQLIAVLPESTDAARAAIAAKPDKVLFTGSAATGRVIQSQLSRLLIPSTMELSGCDAVIVRPDADLELVVSAIAFGLTLNGGETCMAPRRMFAARSLVFELEERLRHTFALGSSRSSPASPGQPSPRLTTAAADHLRSSIHEALGRGASFIAGGLTPDGSIQFPVILGDVPPDAKLLRKDVFAPVLCLVAVADDEEAVALTNQSLFALTASIFSRDEARARTLARRVAAGIVTINDLILPTADARLPFGGRRASGFGVTRGAEGLLELTTPKVITRTRGTFRPAFKPTQRGDEDLVRAYLTLTHSHGIQFRWRAFASLMRIIWQRRIQRG